MCDECKQTLLDWSHTHPYPIDWCICGAADCHPSAATASYATHSLTDWPWCTRCSKWLRPGWRKAANHMGLGRSWYVATEDGH